MSAMYLFALAVTLSTTAKLGIAACVVVAYLCFRAWRSMPPQAVPATPIPGWDEPANPELLHPPVVYPVPPMPLVDWMDAWRPMMEHAIRVHCDKEIQLLNDLMLEHTSHRQRQDVVLPHPEPTV